MTSPTQPPVADALSDDQADLPDSVDSSADSETKAAIPAFKFPFKPRREECQPALVQERRQERPYQDPGRSASWHSSLDGQALTVGHFVAR